MLGVGRSINPLFPDALQIAFLAARAHRSSVAAGSLVVDTDALVFDERDPFRYRIRSPMKLLITFLLLAIPCFRRLQPRARRGIFARRSSSACSASRSGSRTKSSARTSPLSGRRMDGDSGIACRPGPRRGMRSRAKPRARRMRRASAWRQRRSRLPKTRPPRFGRRITLAKRRTFVSRIARRRRSSFSGSISKGTADLMARSSPVAGDCGVSITRCP